MGARHHWNACSAKLRLASERSCFRGFVFPDEPGLQNTESCPRGRKLLERDNLAVLKTPSLFSSNWIVDSLGHVVSITAEQLLMLNGSLASDIKPIVICLSYGRTLACSVISRQGAIV